MYEYLVSGAVYISRLPYNLMLRELTRHDWGLVGCVEPCSQYDATIPNKLFEYMAAGIPIIVLNADECAEFVMQTGIGVVVNSMDDIPEIYGDNEKYRKKVLEVRVSLPWRARYRRSRRFTGRLWVDDLYLRR